MKAYSAPGKLMLFGEYAVLEGHPAVALCLDKRIRCTASAEGEGITFDAPDLLGDRGPITSRDMTAPPDPALRLLWPLIQQVMPMLGGLRLRFDAEFPATWGLGSSSASSLAAVAAVQRLLGHDFSAVQLFEVVRWLQQQVQGEASGYDAATQLTGGVVRFVGGAEPVIERLPVRRLPWVVAYTGAKASTGDMIRQVRARHPVGHRIYGRIGDLATRGAELLVAGDCAAIGEALDEGHALLDVLGAVPEALRGPIAALHSNPWVHGARLSGAGGGDCVLILAVDFARASDAARAEGFEILPLWPEDTGLRAEPLEES